jgi:nucleotide-binding universal stress UspA family protein
MPAFERILFPVDFSERCRHAAKYAAAMARKCGAELTALHVIDLPVSVYSSMGYETMLDLPAMRTAARDQLEAFVREEFEGYPVRIAVEEGRAAPRIVEHASANAMDLIMMPTHGYGPFRRTLLGSVTAKVLHDATCPVWTSAHAEVEQPGGVEIRSMLCAVDLERKSVPLIRRAARLADEFGAPLRLVHALPEIDAPPETVFDVEFRRFAFERAREELLKLQAEAGVNLEMCIHAGSPAKVARLAAEHHQADLLVIGRGVLHEPLGAIRTNTYALIRESVCPVLSW